MINLMGYSVIVDNDQQAEKLQEIAISQGFEWKYLGKNVSNLYARSFQFGCNGENIITYNNGGVHFQDEYITKKAHFNELFETKFVPTAMKCTQEQFEAIKPKLKGCRIEDLDNFEEMPYLINYRNSEKNNITNYLRKDKSVNGMVVYEEWNEDVFLKACGIEIDTIEQQLEKAKAEVARLEKLINAKNELKRIQKLIESLENESKN